MLKRAKELLPISLIKNTAEENRSPAAVAETTTMAAAAVEVIMAVAEVVAPEQPVQVIAEVSA